MAKKGILTPKRALKSPHDVLTRAFYVVKHACRGALHLDLYLYTAGQLQLHQSVDSLLVA